MEARHVNEFHRHLGLLLEKEGMGEEDGKAGRWN